MNIVEKFEVGKYYKHTTGHMFHVVANANTTYYGDNVMIGETNEGKFFPVGSDTQNYVEISEAEWMEHVEK